MHARKAGGRISARQVMYTRITRQETVSILFKSILIMYEAMSDSNHTHAESPILKVSRDKAVRTPSLEVVQIQSHPSL